MQTAADERLLRALAEQIKLPLVQIARSAELGQAVPDLASWGTVSLIADTALQLVDAFLLSAGREQQALPLEPVSVSSVLRDVAYKLAPLARYHDCDVAVHLSGRYGPVMADRKGLETALTLLGASLIEAHTTEDQRHELVLAAHLSPAGLVAGVFDNQSGLSVDMLRRGRALYGRAKQPLPDVTSSSGAGIFVADALLSNMAAPLHVARHHKLSGLAATLHPSRQLQLVA